jgi:hypothetical protein
MIGGEIAARKNDNLEKPPNAFGFGFAFGVPYDDSTRIWCCLDHRSNLFLFAVFDVWEECPPIASAVHCTG